MNRAQEEIGQIMHGLSEQELVEDKNLIYQNVVSFPRISTSKELTMLLVGCVKSYQITDNGGLFYTEGIYLDEKYTYRYFDYRPVFVEKQNRHSIAVKITFTNQQTVRIQMQQGFVIGDNITPMISGMAVEKQEISVSEDDQQVVMTNGTIVAKIQKNPWQLSLIDQDGKVFYQQFGRDDHSFMPYEICPFGFLYDQAVGEQYACEAVHCDTYEHFYGLGENFSALDRKGRAFQLWNTNALGVNTDRGYKNIPFYISSTGYGVFINTSHKLNCDMGGTLSKASSLMVGGAHLDLFIMRGTGMKEILPLYYQITGWPVLPPKWSFGLWISKISYGTRAEVETVAKRMRTEQIPCDVIHIDTDWFAENWVCDWKFDEQKFPAVEEMINNLHQDGYKLSLWQLPYVERGRVSYQVYDEGVSKGYFASAPDGDMRFPHGLIDFSNPEAVRWFKDDLIKPLLRQGIDVIKVDFGESAPSFFKYAGVDGDEMHNLYALLYNQAVYEAAVEELGAEKAIIWARSAWAGSQKYPVHWGGDAGTDFASLASSVKGSLSVGLSGLPFWSSDIGGFWFDVSSKLYIRWSQYGMFCSHARLHGFYTREPWDFGDEALEIFRNYARLRYRLMPYIYSQAVLAVTAGMPMHRAMVYDFGDDLNTVSIDTQYMFGDSLLVAPVLREDDLVNVYLPAGQWTDFHNDVVYEGGRWLSYRAAIDILPVYVRANAIIPMGPEMNYVDELVTDPYTLHFYPFGGSGSCKIADNRNADDQIDIKMQSGESELIVTITEPDHNYQMIFHNILASECQINGLAVNFEQAGSSTLISWTADTDTEAMTVSMTF